VARSRSVPPADPLNDHADNDGTRALRRHAVTAAVTGAAAATIATAGTAPASATPFPHVDVKHHTLIVDIPAGETRTCQAVGNQWPFLAYAPGYLQYATGPTKLYFNQFPHGTQIWISCNGIGAPPIWYGPVLGV